MKTKVEVLLRENVAPLGRCGDVVKVAAGYARNYLLPRRLAVQANDDNKGAMLRRRAKLEVEETRRAAEVGARVAALASVVVRTSGKADEKGHLYGSVSAREVADLLRAAGHAIEEGDVRLETPLKTVGTHAVRVHVQGETFAEIQVEVAGEASSA